MKKIIGLNLVFRTLRVSIRFPARLSTGFPTRFPALFLLLPLFIGCADISENHSKASSHWNTCVGEVTKSEWGDEQILDSPSPWCIAQAIYPTEAWDDGVEGYVLVNYSVFKNGRVGNIKVLESDPEGVFDSVAVESMERSFYVQGDKDYHDIKRKITFKMPSN